MHLNSFTILFLSDCISRRFACEKKTYICAVEICFMSYGFVNFIIYMRLLLVLGSKNQL